MPAEEFLQSVEAGMSTRSGVRTVDKGDREVVPYE